MAVRALVVWASVAALHVASGVTVSRSDPCYPSPCGRNTRCTVSHTGAAVCRCLEGYFPKPDTITGCGPQCTSDYDCPHDHRCRGTQCEALCVSFKCGTNAICEPANHKARCRCIAGYAGDPYNRCSADRLSSGRAISVSSPSLLLSRISDDPCSGTPCGHGAQCRNAGNRPVCSCLPGHFGDPYRGCARGECEDNSGCPSHKACKNNECVSPCTGSCGVNSECDVRNHVAVCRCPRNYVGDPFSSCRRFDPQELCSPSPCGQNTQCRVENERAVCSCLPTYQGNAITGCRHECDSDYECGASESCIDYRCKNPCTDACGENANCEVRNHRAVCSCPPEFLGDAYSRCYPECTTHADCSGNKACFAFKCTDPCSGACGTNADCRVQNHKAICSCPKGYTGHPFDKCRPFDKTDLCHPNPCGANADCRAGFDNTGKDRPVCTCPPGYVGDPLSSCQRGECQSDGECQNHRTCINYECRNPCDGACGVDARCDARNHGAVCSCPPGYTGDPVSRCYRDSKYRGKK